MKKIICFLALASLIAVSCSSDSDDNPNPDNNTGVVLLKKTITTDSDGATQTMIATYDGTKLVKFTGDGNNEVSFTYAGDNITQIIYKTGATTFRTDTFTYHTDGKMASYIRIAPLNNTGRKEVYTHNADGTISVDNFSGDANSQTFPGGTGTIVFSDGEVSQITSGEGIVYTYTYDAKNNPFKNVTGYSKITYADSSTDGFEHNVLVETISTDDDVVNTFIYNANDYPESSVQVNGGNETTTQYFYE